ncbi:MAG: hypothetical protein ACRDV2_00035, partial [Actinomycetes bacterium]
DVNGQIDLTGNVTGLNLIGTSFVPGFGPVVAIPAAALLSDKPSVDGLREFISPFGEPDVSSPGAIVDSAMPAWMKRFVTAWRDDPQSDRVYGNTVADVARLLVTSGEYTQPNGLISADDRVRLLADAQRKARQLYLLRAAAQFVLPTGPQPQFSVDIPDETRGGLYTFSALATEYRRMQEDVGYDEALEVFVERFGYDTLTVTQAKSREVRIRSRGRTGANWERDHPELVAAYPNVIGLFAPDDPADVFDYAAYERQLRAGDRDALTPADQLALYNNTVGYAAYNAAKSRLGAQAVTIEGRAYLSDLRAALKAEDPGFDAVDAVAGKVPVDAQVAELVRAAADERIAATDAGAGLAAYLRVREDAVEQARDLGLVGFGTADRAAPIRARLRAEAAGIIEQHPRFAGVWSRVFEREMSDDDTPLVAAPPPWWMVTRRAA